MPDNNIVDIILRKDNHIVRHFKAVEILFFSDNMLSCSADIRINLYMITLVIIF